MKFIPDVLNETEIDLLRALPQVNQAYKRLSTEKNVYFDAEIPESSQERLRDTLGFEVRNKRIPFRWIRGDTAPHVDRGSTSFEHTYLVYLTDGEGQFQIGDDSYPITAGSGFVFSEGLEHEVIGTHETSRLLLGPMNELGNPVGEVFIISANGETDTVYIREVEGIQQYSTDQSTWSTINWPAYIQNTSASPASNILKVLFTTDLTFTTTTSGYLVLNSNGIQIGDKTLRNTGTKTTITIDGVTDYGGFVSNSSTYSNTYVYNLHIAAINGSTLGGNGGWVGRYNYGYDATNNFIIGCSSDGPISTGGGGIVGGDAGNSSGDEGVTAELTIVGCTSSGAIGETGGGIIGDYAGSGNGASVTILKCSSSGLIGIQAGGIAAQYAGQNSGSCTVTKCYSTGAIGSAAGGIFGWYAGNNEGQATAQDCYSRGTIGTDAGGIFGVNAAASSGTTTAVNCYSSGLIDDVGAGGIYGDGQGEGASSFGNYNADGTWSDENANAQLDDIFRYISTGINQPFELRAIGPSPYSLTTIGTTDMTLTYSQSVAAGSSSSGSVIFGVSSFSILEIDGESPAEIPTITINGTTGTISTTSGTPTGTYAIIVRAVTNPYSITTFTLTVTTASPPAPTTAGTLDTKGRQFNNNDYTLLQQGQRFVIERREVPNLRFNSFAEYNKYLVAQASFRK